jgi:RimJ/RimL family protein N-acetyltransferase
MGVNDLDIRTQRLQVRDYWSCDEGAIKGMLHTSLVNNYTVWSGEDISNVQRFMYKYEYFVIATISSDYNVLGFCRLNPVKPGVYNVGYYLCPGEWGKGYATEIALGLMKFAFEVLDARKVIATCDPRNVHSERVMKRCGMVYEGHVREDVLLPNGKYRDSLYYSMLRHEFENL